MAYENIVTIKEELFVQLVSHAPPALREQATGDAQQAVWGLCFTAQDIEQHCQRDARWARLAEDDKADAVAYLLDAGEYEHAAKTANAALAEAVERYLDETVGKEEPR